MCGILGYYNVDGNPVGRSREEVLRLRDMMTLRGPDSAGYLQGAAENWILAHRRLSILDLTEAGHQPMSDPEGKVHICYNGEIYNFRTLRSALIDHGYTFRSNCDTEVILYLYKHYGTACFQKLEGMFALIIVDEEKHHAVIARDPVGKKPIYYAMIQGNVVIASDPGVVSRDRLYERDVSVDGLYSMLTMGGVRSPNSLFKGIYKLEPGCFRIIDKRFDATSPSTRFFDFSIKPRGDLVENSNAVETLDRLLDKAVEKRLISDVPFGIFLSGGIDSALILHYMSRYTDRVNTFSIDLETSEDAKRETHIAAELARRFNTNHHNIVMKTDEYIEILDEVVLPNSTPGMTDCVLLARLSETARKSGVIVIETGEGADEVFMGYDHYLQLLNEGYEKLRRLRSKQIPFPLLARLARMFGSDAGKERVAYITDTLDIAADRGILRDFIYEPFFSYQAARIAKRKYGSSVRESKFSWLNSSVLSRVANPDDYLPSGLSVLWNATFRWADLLLNRIDNFTMTASVEGRAPFLDVDVINFGLSLSDGWKVRNGTGKHILREIARREISPEHAVLPKRGFGGGGSNLLNEKVRRFLRGKLLASSSYRCEPLLPAKDIEDKYQLLIVTAFHVWVDAWM